MLSQTKSKPPLFLKQTTCHNAVNAALGYQIAHGTPKWLCKRSNLKVVQIALSTCNGRCSLAMSGQRLIN